MADNLKRSGAYIPGIRPGEQTASFIDLILSRLTVFGAFYLSLVCILPLLLVNSFGISFYLGGTSVLIVVVVMLDLQRQIQSYVMSQQYASILKNANISGSKKSRRRWKWDRQLKRYAKIAKWLREAALCMLSAKIKGTNKDRDKIWLE